MENCTICNKKREEFFYINGSYICQECSFEIFLNHAKELSKLKMPRKTKKHNNRLLSELSRFDFEDPKYYLVTKRFYDLFQSQVNEDNSGIQDVFKAKEDQIVHVKRMYELDKRTPDQMKHVYDVLSTSEFWRLKVRSMSKLREQMDKLLLEKTDRKTNGIYKEQLTSREL